MITNTRAGALGLLTAMIGLGATRAALLILGFARTRRLAEWLAPQRIEAADSTAASEAAVVSAITSQVARAGALFPGRAICLEQSLVLHTLLRRRGIAAQLCLGVQPLPFVAHAWVEVNGAAVGDTEDRIRLFHPLRSKP